MRCSPISHISGVSIGWISCNGQYKNPQLGRRRRGWNGI